MRRLILACALLGCSSGGGNEPPAQTPYVPCAGITVPRAEGGCADSGIRACPTGFALDAGGCVAVLPELRCSPGSMAIPGDKTCHPVAECGTGDWYDAPASAIHVDAASASTTPDGSIANPYAKLQDALDAAPEGATIALADGVYKEAIAIHKKVEIVGRCPTKASIEPDEATIAVDVQAPATIRRIAITSPNLGLSVYETEGFVGDQLWIHDTANVAFDVERKTKTASAKLSHSLVEDAGWAGVIGIGGKIEIDSVLVRDIHRIDDGRRGIGIFARSEGTETGSLRVTGSFVERVRQWGIATQDCPMDVRATLVRTVVEDAEVGAGLVAAQRPDVTPRSTVPIPVHLDGVVVEDVIGVGALFDHVDASMHAITMRAIRPGAKPHSDGLGLQIERSTATFDEGLIENVARAGFAFVAAKGTVSRLLVRDLSGLDSLHGIGIYAGDDPAQTSADLTLSDSRVDRSMTQALLILGSKATVARCVFDQIASNADGYGDGIAVTGDWVPGPDFVRATVSLDQVNVAHAARAGLAAFGGSDVSVARSAFLCAAFDLEVNEKASETASDTVKIEDLGGSVCGCDAERRDCRAQSSSLTPIPQESKTEAH
jgi:hypothetical protein